MTDENKDNSKNQGILNVNNFYINYLISIALMQSISIASKTSLYGLSINRISGDAYYSNACFFNTILAFILMFTYYLIITDSDKLMSAVSKSPSKWWCLCPPVYLWKRANILNESKLPFILYFVINVVGSVVCTISSLLVNL